MEDKVSIVRRHCLVENDPSDSLPVFDEAALYEPAFGGTLIGHIDVENQRALRLAVALVIDVAEDFVTEIEVIFSLNLSLIWSHC